MKFDTIIIGGGLAGLTCGIKLQKSGKKCLIVSSGQSALHFSSGAFDLLTTLKDGTEVENAVEAVSKLDSNHPYSIIGSKFAQYAEEAKGLLNESGVEVVGCAEKRAYKITPMGTMKPTWLSLNDFSHFDNPTPFKGKKVALINIEGFLDFNTKFVADNIEATGANVKIVNISLPEVERLRKSPTEMRSSNIAKVLQDKNTLNALLSTLKCNTNGFDVVALPAVFGLFSLEPVKVIKEQMDTPVCLIPTMPPSVPGVRSQRQLRSAFERLGGTYMLGDTVVSTKVDGLKAKSLYTVNHVEEPLEADTFVLATGSFFSNGLHATPNAIEEPIFGSDVNFSEDRGEWFDQNVFNKQNYMTFGVDVDSTFHIKKNGKSFENVYAIGSILSGFNPIYEGCGGGVSMLTALFVADNIK